MAACLKAKLASLQPEASLVLAPGRQGRSSVFNSLLGFKSKTFCFGRAGSAVPGIDVNGVGCF